MARSSNNKQQTADRKTESINPLVDLFQDACYDYFQELDKVAEVWNDAASDSFRHEVTEHSRKVTKEYLMGVVEIYHRYTVILEEAEKLTKWNAGFGGWMSFLDLSMVAERGISRLFFNRDDHRF